MEIKDLVRIISDSYPLGIVDFENEYPNEAYCIRPIRDHWEVYYSERGLKSGREVFETETLACEYLLEQLKE